MDTSESELCYRQLAVKTKNLELLKHLKLDGWIFLFVGQKAISVYEV